MTAPSTLARCCPHCNTPLVRRAGETHWERRRFCNNDCATAYRIGRALVKRDNTKPCACGCGAILSQKEYETPHKWQRRRYAEKACYFRSVTKPIEQRESKVCECCGVTFHRTTGIDGKAWKIRRYCTQACHIAVLRQENAQRSAVMAEGRAEAMKRREAARPSKVCQCCGVVFVRPRNIKNTAWENRKFCGVPCGSKGKARPQMTSAERAEVAERQKRARRQKMIADAIANAKPERVVARFQSVEEFLAAGGQIIRCPTVAVAPTSGIEIAERDRQMIAARYAAQDAKFDNRPRVFG